VRVLGITETCDLGSLYLRLLAEGHEVKVIVSEPLAQGTMAGLVPRAQSWQEELPWIEADDEGIILFEAVGFGELQDRLRREGFKVIGGSAFGDRLENDRAYAFDLLGRHGMTLAPVREFRSSAEAIADLEERPRRCVFKRCDSAGDTFVGTLLDGRDVVALLRVRPVEEGVPFILMDYVEGVETGVGAYFNGTRFLRPACLDWEHKRFFAGNMGELTGEMGTVATFRCSDRLFETALEPLESLFRDAGHVGWVNLNTIINEAGVWPLEFTCRFGYPGFAVLEPLQGVPWSALLDMLVTPDSSRFATADGFSACVVLTTPPMPLSRREVDAPVGLPVLVGDIDPLHLHLGEVGTCDLGLVTAGLYGWTAVVTGTGTTVAEAKAAAYENAAKVQVPNMRYRLDIGDSLMNGELELLSNWGWLT
jgi:phosphoribosylamine---glycine ligase